MPLLDVYGLTHELDTKSLDSIATGLAVCETCRGGMMLRTGTSKSGRVYRYYTCSSCATKGKTACKGRSISMEKLDTLVTEHLLERLFKPERIAIILASL